MAIQSGDTAPDFTLPVAGGGTLTLSEAWRDSPVVLVFFPLAFSGRCQSELCEIRDNLALFEDASVRVIAISVDSHFSLQAWAKEQGYTFDLASDMWPHGEVASAYEVFLAERGIAARASFLIDTQGVVRWSTQTDSPADVRPLTAYREALATL